MAMIHPDQCCYERADAIAVIILMIVHRPAGGSENEAFRGKSHHREKRWTRFEKKERNTYMTGFSTNL